MCIDACSLGGNNQILLESVEPFLDKTTQPELALEHALCLAFVYYGIDLTDEAETLLENSIKWATELQSPNQVLNAGLGRSILLGADIYVAKERFKEAEGLPKPISS
jgi:hypothetical protein